MFQRKEKTLNNLNMHKTFIKQKYKKRNKNLYKRELYSQL